MFSFFFSTYYVGREMVPVFLCGIMYCVGKVVPDFHWHEARWNFYLGNLLTIYRGEMCEVLDMKINSGFVPGWIIFWVQIKVKLKF